MDFIIRKLNQKINLAKELENASQLKTLLQVKIEYSLLFLLSYFKNKNYEELELEDQEYINRVLIRPTVGDLASAITKLTKNEEKTQKNLYIL